MSVAMRPPIAIALGFGALLLAGLAAASVAPRLYGWVQAVVDPAVDASAYVSRGGDGAAALDGRMRALAAAHGLGVESVAATSSGEQISAKITAGGEEARVLRWIAAVEQARPAMRIDALELRRSAMTPNGAANLQVTMTVIGRHQP
jgi:hypothetical protein